MGKLKQLVSFDSGSAGPYALINRSNRYDIAWFLIQHKPQLSLKTTRPVSIFQSVDPDGDVRIASVMPGATPSSWRSEATVGRRCAGCGGRGA
jgi:hypothetical protein